MATGGAARTALGARVLLACMMWALVAFPAAAETFDCNVPNASPPSDITIALDPATPWQPRGGSVRVILRSVTQALKDVDVTICFRWSGVANDVKYLPPATVQLVEASAAKAVYSVTLPDGSALPAVKSSWFGRLFGAPPAASSAQPTHFDNLMIVPIADAMVIVGASDTVLASAVLQVGITSVWNAVLTTLVAVLIAHGLLYLWAVRRQVPGRSPWMRLVSTREGHASLSQAQIMIWSFLFGAGAVYVMILSGSLFDITNTALVLLGISGATTVGAKIQMASARNPAAPASELPVANAAPGSVQGLRVVATTDHSVTLAWTAPAGTDPAVYTVSCARQSLADWQVAAERIANTGCRATRLAKDTVYDFDVVAANAQGRSAASRVTQKTLSAATTLAREPKWSDLVVTPQHPEIDVTRVQMLFFTLISASFVAIKLITSFAIPDIPEGFMLLMGISNGVYLTAKFVPD